ncbi:MAG: flagellar hook-associated protein FlgK [Alphaproteobacteria bacterium]
MSLTSAINSAVTGLGANQRGLEIASHNIGNANTEGYSRRIVHRESVVSAGAGAGGVRVLDIERATNRFLTDQVRTEGASLGRPEIRNRYLTDTQDLFGALASNSSISQRLADLSERMETLAVEPESSTGAASLIDGATIFARDLNAISSELVRLRAQADGEIGNAVRDINNDLELVADLNEKIANEINLGSDPGDLQDKRDLALRRVGDHINIKTFERSSGEVVVFTGDSQILLDGEAVPMDYAASANGSLNTTFGEITVLDGISIQGDIRDGKIKGLLELRDKVLPNLHRQMDALASNTRDLTNTIHNRGMGLPAASVLTGSRTFADTATDTVDISSDVRFVIANSSGLAVATFDLRGADGPFTIDGLADAINLGFVGAAADPLDPAAVASVVGGKLKIQTTDTANGIGMVDLNGGADTVVTFNNGAGDQTFSGFSNFFGLNDFFVSDGLVEGDTADEVSGRIAVRADIAAGPELISRGRLSTGEAPTPGTDHVIAVGDGRIMSELGAAFSSDRAIDATGGLPSINKPLHDYAAEIVGLNSQFAAEEKERLAFEEALVTQFQTRLTDKTAVNVDEELANILILQTAFSASARVITTADEMLQTLMQLKR